MNALFFDIDGTLLKCKANLGQSVLSRAFEYVFNRRIVIQNIHFSGKTDLQIIHEVAIENNLSEEINFYLPEIYRQLIEYYQKEIQNDKDAVQILPFVEEVLIGLQHQAIGIITGNILPVAQLKLDTVNLSKYFPCSIGGYGEESINRSDLFHTAISKLHDHYNTKKFEKIFIIGDSFRDIENAKTNHCLSLAVATGRETEEMLLSHSPTFFVADFCNIQQVIDILNGNR